METTVGRTSVRWVGGGLWLRHGSDGLLIDAPPGVEARLGAELPRLRALLLTGGRMQSVGGLVPLLDALVPHRRGAALAVHTLLGEERGVALAETWARAWSSPYPLTLDAERPGGTVDVGPFAVELVPMKAGEPDWAKDAVRARPQVAVRIEVDGRRVAFGPGAAPGTAAARLFADADLAVVEVGVTPWPASPSRWRFSAAEAAVVAAGAAQVWLVGDDGASLPAEVA